MPTIETQLRRLGIPDHLIKTATVNGKPLAKADTKDHAELIEPGLLSIVIHATPIGKPRMTQRDKWMKRGCVMRYRAWCDRVRACVGDMVPDASRVNKLSIAAYFEMPKSWPKKKRINMVGKQHRVRPDADNIAKACMDSIWKSDSGIAHLEVVKLWCAQSRCEIRISSNI